jgi:peptidoglycan hydrolase-like protein with peptidoglycan-binding domain
MISTRIPLALLATVACLAACPALASAAESPASTTPVASTPAAAPAAGKLKLVLQHVGGNPLFAAVGSRIVVRGVVLPYVAGQSVKLTFYREGKKVGVQTASVEALANGAGQFHVDFTSRQAGRYEARAVHYATATQAAFSARTRVVSYVHTNVAAGSSGLSVRVMQEELANLHYAVPLNGTFDELTGLALVAFRKMTNLDRIPSAGSQVFALLARHAGQFHVRYLHDGRHVEANLTKQVLAEIEPGGKIHAIYTTSSGKPSTPTVIGRFTVYSRTPGTNSEGMVDSNYFIRGYAIHGYAEVPTYAASHGCLRVPIPDAPTIYGWVRYGTPVDVYNQDGGGSATVRNNAGP